MKKVYLLAGALATGLAATAQINVNAIPAKNSREGMGFSKAKVSSTGHLKAEGDVHWTNDFSTPSDWVISNAGAAGTPPHTAGDWAIVNAMPTSLTDQAAAYGFPVAIGSASGGNFALVNSDAAGGGATQNAYLTTATGIDLSALGSTALYLEFTEIYRHYYDENYVQISNDGGANWMEFAVNPVSEVPVNTNSGNPEYETVNITPAIGAGTWGSDVRIRFRYQGAWDWFWGIDDVQIVEAWDNDIRVANWYQATDIATTNGLDYYMVPQSQTDFPGLTFGAIVNNNGGVTQSDVALHVTSPSLSYDETGSTVALASGESDTVSITTPLMLSGTVGSYAVNVSSDMAATDADVTNNEATFNLERTEWIYSRDDGNYTGAISQVTSQNDAALKIGNVMDIFSDMDMTFVQVRLVNQAAAVGQQIYAEVYVFDTDWSFYAETQPYTIQNGDLNNFVTLPLDGGELSLTAGQTILVVAGHYGGANEVGFGMAQPTYEGTVQGFTANGEGFQLTSPNAIMIRVSDQPLAIDEEGAEFGVSVFPNPAADAANVSFELPNTADVAVTVTDLSGKVVYSNVMANTAAGKHTVNINTAAMAGGVYTVNFTTNNTVVTKKLVVKK